MELSMQDAATLERVVDPNSSEFKELMMKLLKPPNDELTRMQRLTAGPEFKYTLPYKGDPDLELEIQRATSFQFSDKANYRNGVASLALAALELVDLIVGMSGRKRMAATLVVSAEAQSLHDIMYSAGTGAVSTLIYYCGRTNLASQCVSLADKLDSLIVDHTTVNLPIDELLNFSYRAGIKVVDGVFPFHVAALRGWDTVTGLGK